MKSKPKLWQACGWQQVSVVFFKDAFEFIQMQILAEEETAANYQVESAAGLPWQAYPKYLNISSFLACGRDENSICEKQNVACYLSYKYLK